MSLSNKIILLTGGTGSFGTKFTEIALKEFQVKTIRIFSRGELMQQKMREQFDDERLRFFIGDVRDRDRLYRAMNNVDIVIHAAALKQVPACEYNPIEAVKTNIEGAINVIDVAIDNKVKKVLALSTDKAVYPVNLYGATKLVMEKLFIQANIYAGSKGTIFSCVRYGNIIGSRGSLVQLLKKQAKSGAVTITDKRMARFWITQEQAVHFVISCIERMHGREIFIPKIPSMKIVDLVEVIVPEAKHKIVGIRPGEKISETLLTKEEAHYSKEFPEYFVVEPKFPFLKKIMTGGKPLPEGFKYTTKNNNWWLTKEDLRKMLGEYS